MYRLAPLVLALLMLVATAPTVTTASLKPGEINRGLEGASLADAPGMDGARVRGVAPGSPAAQAGLRNNDLIIGVNQETVGSVQRWNRAQGASTRVLEIRRGNTIVLVPVR
ncbi:MAG: PDZ domain-containing protein [Steroidobacteraceae bacterium]